MARHGWQRSGARECERVGLLAGRASSDLRRPAIQRRELVARELVVVEDRRRRPRLLTKQRHVLEAVAERRLELLGCVLVHVMGIARRILVAVRGRQREDAAGGQHAGKLVQRPFLIAHVLDDLEADDEVEAVVVVRQGHDVSGDELDPVTDRRPRGLDRLLADVDAARGASAGTHQDLGAIPEATAGIEDTPVRRDLRGPPIAGEVLGLDELTAHLAWHVALGRGLDGVTLSHRRTLPAQIAGTPTRRVRNNRVPMELAFVTAQRQNHFFVELIAALRDELDQLGVPSRVATGSFPAEEPGLVYVLVPPHEWFALHGYRRPPTRRQLRRTIFVCAEQPFTSFFVDNALLAPFAGAVFDISTHALAELGRHGIKHAQHLQLGWTRSWTTIDAGDLIADDPQRDIDVLHLGNNSERRGRALASGAHTMSRFNAKLLLAHPDAPNHKQRQNFAIEDEKLRLLRRTRVLLNIHQGDRPYFEWLRVVQAVSQGCAVVSEHSVGHAPLELGTHLLGGTLENVVLLAAGLLEDEGERRRIAAAAHRMLREELPLRAAVERLASSAAELVRAPAPPLGLALPALTSPSAPSIDLDDEFRGPRHDPEAQRSSIVRRALKDLRLEMIELRRRLLRDESERRAARELPQVVIDATTTGWAQARPARVTVITALYNHASYIGAALDSVAAGAYRDVEFVVVDDGSTDGSGDAVRRFMALHPDRSVMLARHPVNRGLGVARNTALSFARGELVFVLDADNAVHVHGLQRLVETLDTRPDAGFAYGMLDVFNSSGPIGLVSCYPWEPQRLRNGNYIDAMALWRRAVIDGLGRYTTAHALYGWEDYDLWCRCAEHGVDGAFVAQIVASYRTSRHSMISMTDLSVTTAFSMLCERYPKLMAGVPVPA